MLENPYTFSMWRGSKIFIIFCKKLLKKVETYDIIKISLKIIGGFL